MEQSFLVFKFEDSVVNNIQNEDSIVFLVSVILCVFKDGGYIQLMLIISIIFGNLNNILIVICMIDLVVLGIIVSQFNVVVLFGNFVFMIV